MDQHEIDKLIARYDGGTATPEEISVVERILFGPDDDDANPQNAHEVAVQRELWLSSYARIQQRRSTTKKIYRVMSYAAAALFAGVLLFAGGRYYRGMQPKAIATTIADVAPGASRATLTLADGSVVDLEQHKNGQVAAQGYANVQKSAAGKIVYTLNPQLAGKKVAPGINTISTPKGGEFAIELPDGTKAWLNAASSMTFATDLGSGSSRELNITGEVYFEVKKDEARPFRVKAGSQVVEVLGTHFSINSYADEPQVKTALFEGSVRITSPSLPSGVTLKPGQQALFSNTKAIEIFPVDASVIAWKDGLIRFRGSDLKTVMRQLARWYDRK
ncbi:FecR domain-containing protein [Chitinophaga sedimenti]|uniref:FecR family protein n=1 Tax=Chitinophaga sedimenti TaxID=2033606 RepID=UPI0020063FAB|nr:FecR domain-containing protein [Chitinophaga sedimenti]MCK7553740.1 FecR domain-containing protein [Chitinophaga sedimenti]